MEAKDVVDLTGEEESDEDGLDLNPNVFRMEFKGQPKPMQRPRKCRNTWMSPSKAGVN